MSFQKIGFAFSGPVASGKSFTAKSISCILDSNVYSFSTKLKQFTNLLESKYPALNDGNVTKNRELLRNVGQGLKSILGNDIWINATLKNIHDDIRNSVYSDNISISIIDDLRFISEYNALKNDKVCKWYFIYLSVPQLTRLTRIKELYPENWEDHFYEPNIGNEIIPIYKYDCIALSIDHTLKFIHTIIKDL